MKKILLLTLMASLTTFTCLQASDVYDLSTSFTPHDSSNPNGVWSFGRNTTLKSSNFALNTAYDDGGFWGGSGGISVWWNETTPTSPFPGGWPLIWHSFTYTETAPAQSILAIRLSKPASMPLA